MKKNFIKIMAMMFVLITVLGTMVGCLQTTPSVTFGFKTSDSADQYNESVDVVEVGKNFYTCINLKFVTNKKKPRDYTIKVEVPKTDYIVIDHTGGLRADSVVWDESKEASILTFTVKGSKEAVTEKILFRGTPTGEGKVVLSVDITDDNGKSVGKGYFRTLYFEYELD
jgi:hypothetical protein